MLRWSSSPQAPTFYKRATSEIATAASPQFAREYAKATLFVLFEVSLGAFVNGIMTGWTDFTRDCGIPEALFCQMRRALSGDRCLQSMQLFHFILQADFKQGTEPSCCSCLLRSKRRLSRQHISESSLFSSINVFCQIGINDPSSITMNFAIFASID